MNKFLRSGIRISVIVDFLPKIYPKISILKFGFKKILRHDLSDFISEFLNKKKSSESGCSSSNKPEWKN